MRTTDLYREEEGLIEPPRGPMPPSSSVATGTALPVVLVVAPNFLVVVAIGLAVVVAILVPAASAVAVLSASRPVAGRGGRGMLLRAIPR